MPFIEMKTNVSLSDQVKNSLSHELGEEIKLLNKTEDWLMLNFIDNQSMYFKGSNAPCVIAEVKIYGTVSASLADKFTPAITKTIARLTGVDEGRIYVNYFGTQNWGYSGFNF